MKFCDDHWSRLRAAIEARGLSHLVAKSGEAAHARMTAELNGTADSSTYDPLMNAHWMITNRALQMGGLYLMTGDYCPLCEVVKHTEPAADVEWIDGCTDSVLAYCREHGLIQAPS